MAKKRDSIIKIPEPWFPVEPLKIFIPGEAKAKGRHRSSRIKTKDGREFNVNYTPSDTAKFERLIRSYGEEAMRSREKFQGSLRVYFIFYLPKPLSKKKDQKYCNVKPDWDNYGKIGSDALNSICWSDDAIIAEGFVSKRYAPMFNHPEGLLIKIEQLEDFTPKPKVKK